MTQCFAVPTKCNSEKRTKLLTNLKCLMSSLEEELTPKVEPVCYTPVCITNCVPCCPPAPVCKPAASIQPPDVLVCYKTKTNSSKKKSAKSNPGKDLCESKSRELRGGILHIGCDCERKNGLQDNCLRTGCQGSPECLTSPPTCLPSRYCNGKHLVKMLRNKNLKNESPSFGQEDEGPESVTYQCYGAAVKVPDQKICVFMPTLGCPPVCNYGESIHC